MLSILFMWSTCSLAVFHFSFIFPFPFISLSLSLSRHSYPFCYVKNQLRLKIEHSIRYVYMAEKSKHIFGHFFPLSQQNTPAQTDERRILYLTTTEWTNEWTNQQASMRTNKWISESRKYKCSAVLRIALRKLVEKCANWLCHMFVLRKIG